MFNPIFYKDFYKVGHYEQYPEGTSLIFSNFTPRKSRLDNVHYSVFFGLKYLLERYLNEAFGFGFFSENGLPTDYSDFMYKTLGICKEFKHIEKLKELDYLPIAIYALPEGSIVPEKCPALVIFNTLPEFYWLTNMLETLMSCTLWGACTSATIAHRYRCILDDYARQTSDNEWFVDYQAHDFSFRGMNSLESAIISGAAHLQYFKGTDTIPALLFQHKYYGKPLHLASVAATEHSTMCAGGKDNELDTYKRLINHTYPAGIVSIVSDTWDFWNVIDNYLPQLKDDIMKRDGKVVIRPDSGDPIDIICGNPNATNDTEKKGLIERLWEIFGGFVNSKGYKELDPHIGAIYGDSITLDRCKNICEKLKQKGFASTNIVFGIGSYSYQYNTRDTLGWAMKATYAEINGKPVDLFKDPKTDDGTKKSHKGLLKVVKTPYGYKTLEGVTWDEFHMPDNELKLAFKDGAIYI